MAKRQSSNGQNHPPESQAKSVETVAEPPEMENAVSTMDQSSVAEFVINSAPPVSEELPESITVSAESMEGSSDNEPQAEAFDPAIHCVDEHGQPKLNKDGSYRRKRGRKAGGTNATAIAPDITSPNPQILAVAILATNTTIMIGLAIGGDEWKPMVKPEIGLNEVENMRLAYAEYFRQTGIKEIPAWAGLAIALGSYAMPRLTMPRTQSRVRMIVGKLSGLLGRMFKRKGGR